MSETHTLQKDPLQHVVRPNLYGRSRGPKLSKRQSDLVETLLPKLRINLDINETNAELQPASLFSPEVSDIWLEIGFGGGEHLIWQAKANPQIGFIGCEPFMNGVAKALVDIDDDNINNIRLYDYDARFILDALPEASLGRAFILFPDPWPKKRHHKRRFVTTENLDRLARVMRPGATLRIASDIGDYLRTTLIATSNHESFKWCDETRSDWSVRKPDWPETRYEQKAVREGRKSAYLTFQRK